MTTSALALRATAVALACATSACSSPRGMLAGFLASSHATDVEVFLGDTAITGGEGGACTAGVCRLSPPPVDGNQPDLQGSGWTTRLTTSTHATLDHDSVAWVELDRSANEAAAQALIAVEYDGDVIARAAVVDDLAVEPGEVVEVAMEAARAIDSPDSGGSGLEVDVWRQPDDASRALPACVAAGHADDQVEFIVPADNTACDSATKCAGTALEYCGASAGSSAAAGCLTQTQTKSCRFGGTGCVDTGGACGDPPAPACVADPEVVCIVPEVCGECASWDGNCVFPSPTAPYIACQVPYVIAIDGSGDTSVASCGSGAEIPPGVVAAFIGSGSCGEPFVMPEQNTLAPSRSLAIFDGGMQMTLASIGACDATLSVASGPVTTTPQDPGYTATFILQVATSNGTEDLLIPLVIQPSNGCLTGSNITECTTVFPADEGSSSGSFPCP